MDFFKTTYGMVGQLISSLQPSQQTRLTPEESESFSCSMTAKTTSPSSHGPSDPENSAPEPFISEMSTNESCSPLNIFQIELDSECEVVYEGGPNSSTLFAQCPKNPGHPDFIPVPDFTIDNLPPALRMRENLRTILQWAERTVKITGTAISPYRPDVFPETSIPFPHINHRGKTDFLTCGTGFITAIKESNDKPCSCRSCKRSGRPRMKYLEIFVKTAAHVTYDDFEARDAVIECFYDSGDRGSVKRLSGLSASSSPFCDTSTMICTSHDQDLVLRLQAMMSHELTTLQSSDSEERWGVIISHPHGRSKHITLGNFEVAYLVTDKRKKSVQDQNPSSWKDYLNTFYFKEILDPPTRIRLEKRPNAWPTLKFPAEFENVSQENYEYQFGPSIDIPFSLFNPSDLLSPRKHLIYHRMNHNISTCPGSSGAPTLISSGDNKPLPWLHCPSDLTHSGACSNGNNRSGYEAETFRLPVSVSLEGKKDNKKSIKEKKDNDGSVLFMNFNIRRNQYFEVPILTEAFKFTLRRLLRAYYQR